MSGRGVFLGVPVDLLTLEQSVDRCEQLIEARVPAQHVVINASKTVLMADDPELKAIVASADIVNADGMSVVWGARLLGTRVPERVAGIDLMEALLYRAQERGWPVYFLGARPEVLVRFVAECHARFPELVVAGFRDGYYEDAEDVAERIAESGARLLFLGMSSPMKERFVHEQRLRLGGLLSFGVGGSFDVWAGVTRRAPVWMQRIGLEWFYRLVQEPRRMWRRYAAGNTRFVVLVLREKFAAERHSGQHG